MKIMINFLLVLQSFNLYSQLPNQISESEKIYGLSKVWSEVKRNFVYYDRITFNWDSLYVANIEKVKAVKNDYEYYQLLSEMVAKLKDGHTTVWYPDIYYDKLLGSPPITTKKIENKIIITGVFNQSLLEKGLKRGMEIIKINGLDAKLYAKENVAPYVFSSSVQSYNNEVYGSRLFWGLNEEMITVQVRGQFGKTQNYLLDRKLPKDIMPPSKPTFEFHKTKDNVGVLTINSFWGEDFNKKFENIFKKVLETKALIIDLRDNYGGSSQKAYYVLKHFSKKNYFYGSSWRTRQYRPAFISWGKEEEWYNQSAERIFKAKGKRYRKKIIVLISSRTFSAAEDFLVAFKQMNRGIIIGSPTGGSTGNPIEFDLPNGGGIKICSKEDTYKNGDKFVGIGILPDIEVEETIKNFLEKKDVVMKRAIQILIK